MACAIFIEMRGARSRWGKNAMVALCALTSGDGDVVNSDPLSAASPLFS